MAESSKNTEDTEKVKEMEMVSANLLKETQQPIQVPGSRGNIGWQSIDLQDRAVNMMKAESVQFSEKAR